MFIVEKLENIKKYKSISNHQKQKMTPEIYPLMHFSVLKGKEITTQSI